MAKGYTVSSIRIPAGERLMKALLLQPTDNAQPPGRTAGILWIHGGGYVTGMPQMIYRSRALALCKKYGAVVLTPDYRLAGKAPYPAALTDCYHALNYLHAHAQELNINPSLLMVGGESAGGGLTAALAMAVRDFTDIKIAYQMPLYPMLDDRDTPSSRKNYRLPWNTFFNRLSWKKYLGSAVRNPSPYAAPARQTDYAGLPPCYTFVGNKEPFYSETLSYVENLKKAGVTAHADVYNTGFHAFDMLTPMRSISRQAVREFEKQFASMLAKLTEKSE